eukprot:CAMPEP_0185263754 /NCGR_PEP_ID=MMETSP1359-20130426/16254_1 /TAXON_ID=552665 /ORGANISM="Bigelowiella longifila, Strain CCMP242" /LENGTH=123 /DNA_ID=CAMNT_0027851521 /DNA_START=62 /DNA_END=433 /DNA_ORIENTATION=-
MTSLENSSNPSARGIEDEATNSEGKGNAALNNNIGDEQFEELDAAIAALKKNVGAYWITKLEEKDATIARLESELKSMEQKVVESEERWRKERDRNKSIWDATEKLQSQIKKLTKPLISKSRR